MGAPTGALAGCAWYDLSLAGSLRTVATKTLHYGDNLDVLRRHEKRPDMQPLLVGSPNAQEALL
jgi:hypothetical protein